MYPANFHYTKEHEWVRVEGDIGVVGITDHAQQELGDIVYVDLPKVGSTVEQGKTLASVESVKAVSDVYAPDPHGDAWLVKMKLSAPDEIKQLLSAEDYQSYVGAEGSKH